MEYTNQEILNILQHERTTSSVFKELEQQMEFNPELNQRVQELMTELEENLASFPAENFASILTKEPNLFLKEPKMESSQHQLPFSGTPTTNEMLDVVLSAAKAQEHQKVSYLFLGSFLLIAILLFIPISFLLWHLGQTLQNTNKGMNLIATRLENFDPKLTQVAARNETLASDVNLLKNNFSNRQTEIIERIRSMQQNLAQVVARNDRLDSNINSLQKHVLTKYLDLSKEIRLVQKKIPSSKFNVDEEVITEFITNSKSAFPFWTGSNNNNNHNVIIAFEKDFSTTKNQKRINMEVLFDEGKVKSGGQVVGKLYGKQAFLANSEFSSFYYMAKTQDDLLGEVSMPVGTMMVYFGEENKIPNSWLVCDGRELNTQEYEKLYKVIQATHGSKIKNRTFHLPDFGKQIMKLTQKTLPPHLANNSKTGKKKNYHLVIRSQ